MKHKSQDKKVKVAIYCRVATQAQLDNSAMEGQSARLRQQAQREGFDVVGEVRAYEKGIMLDRTGWETVLSMANEKQANTLMVAGLDRVARGVPLALQALNSLERQGLRLYTCNGDLPFRCKF